MKSSYPTWHVIFGMLVMGLGLYYALSDSDWVMAGALVVGLGVALSVVRSRLKDDESQLTQPSDAPRRAERAALGISAAQRFTIVVLGLAWIAAVLIFQLPGWSIAAGQLAIIMIFAGLWNVIARLADRSHP